MERFTLEHLPAEISSVSVALFGGVEDWSPLRNALVAAAKMAEDEAGDKERDRLDLAFLDARLIVSREHLLLAVHNALLSAATGSLRTPKPSSEILWSLNLSPNIGEAIKTFGCSPSTRHLLAVKISSPELAEDDALATMRAAINQPHATLESLNQLGELADWAAIRKAYRLNSDPALAGKRTDVEERAIVARLVTTSVGAKALALSIECEAAATNFGRTEQEHIRSEPESCSKRASHQEGYLPAEGEAVLPSLRSEAPRSSSRAFDTLERPSSSSSTAQPGPSDGTFLSRWLAQLRPPLTRSASSPSNRPERSEGEASSPLPSPPNGSNQRASTEKTSRPLISHASTSSLAESRQRDVSAETETSPGSVRSKLKMRRPLFRRRSGASGEEPRLSKVHAAPLTPSALRPGTANSTPVPRQLASGLFSPPLLSSTPTVVAPAFPAVPPDLPVGFDAARETASLIVTAAMMALQQLSPSSAVPGSSAKMENRPSISTSASRTSPSEGHGDPRASQVSLPESSAPSGASVFSSAADRNAETSMQAMSALFSGEQLSASSLALPATSFAALYRSLRNVEWLVQNADSVRASSLALLSNQEPPKVEDESQLTTFDICLLVQAVADSLAAYAGQRGVEVVIYHSGQTADSKGRETMDVEAGLAEVFVKGDESAIMLALSSLLQEIIIEAPAGSSVEINLAARPSDPNAAGVSTDDASSVNASETSSLAEAEAASWSISLDMLRTVPRGALLPVIEPEELASLKQISAALLGIAGIGLLRDSEPSSSNRSNYRLSATLPMSRSPRRSASRSRRVDINHEPSRRDLLRFAESSLKGKRVVFHASEKSVFAKHITDFFAGWGTDISYSSTDVEEPVLPGSPTRSEDAHAVPRHPLGRYDSGFASASDTSPSSVPLLSPMEQVSQQTSLTSQRASPSMDNVPPIDPSVNFVVIDDDVPTLKRQLTAIRNNPPIQPHLSSTLLSKRPQLHTRRTRSSAHIRTAGGTPHSLVIVHFTSIANFRTIRDVVRGILRSASPLFPLPDVLVIPKPVGPRRLLTALHTAVKRPNLDPAFAPIATSPASPGGHYFFAGGSGASPRPSPAAVERHYDFGEVAQASVEEVSAAAEGMQAMATAPAPSRAGGSSGHGSAPATPPYMFASPQMGGQPTPLQNSDALEYFSSTASTLSAGGASSGIVIQSPDGKPTGLFFQPTKTHRSMSGGIKERGMSTTSSESGNRPRSSSVAMQREKEAVVSPVAASPSDIPLVEEPANEPDIELPKLRVSETFASERDIDLPRLRAADTFASVLDEADRSPMPSPPGSEEDEASPHKATADELGLVTPQHLGLGQVGRATSEPLTAYSIAPAGQSSPPLHAVRLDSYSAGSGPPRLGRMPTAPAKIPTMQLATSGAAGTISPPQSPQKPASPRFSSVHSSPVAGTASPVPSTPKVAAVETVTPVSPPSAQPSAEATAATTPEKSSAAEPARRRRRSSAKVSSGKKKVKPTKKAATELPVPPINVLIVEDNRINQTILATFMKRRGIRYGIANDGQEAVDMWKTGGFHLVLMDIQLPIKSGIEATIEIRGLERQHNIGTFVQTPTSEVPSPFFGSTPSSPTSPASPSSAVSSPYGLPVIIVALTASSDQADRVAALAAGCNDFLTKPVGLPWLHQKLLEWGSMQLLAGFPRRHVSRASMPPDGQPGVRQQFDAAARGVASRLHLEPKHPVRAVGVEAALAQGKRMLTAAGSSRPSDSIQQVFTTANEAAAGTEVEPTTT